VLDIFDSAAKVLFVVVFFGLCIFFHELGHLLVALWRGLHAERFSIGFGKKIWSTTYRGVEYVIGILPFGGYVSLPQLDPAEDPTTSDGKPLPRVGPIDRALTAVAGPVANLLFGFVLACATWAVGVYEPAPASYCTVWKVPRYLPLYKDGLERDDTFIAVNGKPVAASWEAVLAAIPDKAEQISLRIKRGKTEKTIAYKPVPNPEYTAGLRPMDRIVAVNGKAFTRGWPELSEKIALNTDDLVLRVQNPGQDPRNIVYRPYPNPAAEGLGYPFFEVILPTGVARVLPGSAAEKAGLKKGDRLVRVNGEQVPDSAWFIDRIAGSAGAPLTLTVLRDGNEITLRNVRAHADKVNNETVYRIGIALSSPKVIAHPNPWTQFVNVLTRTGRTLGSLFAPMAGHKSLVRPRHMSGPLGIIQMIWYRLQTEGYRGGLSIIILVTFSLAFFNLLPVPVLDGGHILYALIELVIRRRLPARLVLILQNAFAVLIIGFMLYITSHDVQRWVRVWHMFHPREKEQPQQVQPAKPGATEKKQGDKPENDTGPAAEKTLKNHDRAADGKPVQPPRIPAKK
jgi:regulator of sigma E protease